MSVVFLSFFLIMNHLAWSQQTESLARLSPFARAALRLAPDDQAEARRPRPSSVTLNPPRREWRDHERRIQVWREELTALEKQLENVEKDIGAVDSVVREAPSQLARQREQLKAFDAPREPAPPANAGGGFICLYFHVWCSTPPPKPSSPVPLEGERQRLRTDVEQLERKVAEARPRLESRKKESADLREKIVQLKKELTDARGFYHLKTPEARYPGCAQPLIFADAGVAGPHPLVPALPVEPTAETLLVCTKRGRLLGVRVFDERGRLEASSELRLGKKGQISELKIYDDRDEVLRDEKW